MDLPDLRSAENYINRELSLLAFNQRVLAQALDERVPLLERLKFLCISSNNLDEFFEIRVAGLKQRIELGSDQPGPDGLTITEQLQAIHERTSGLVNAQYACLNDVLLPALRKQGIELLARESWDAQTCQWLEQYFEREVEPVLSPLALDPARPFPRIQNKSLNFIVRVAGKDAFGRDTGLAIVQAPRSLPRVVELPEANGQKRFVLLTGIVQQFVPKLFSGMDVLGCYQFRVTRNSDLFVDDEEVDDLRRALEGELAHRRYGAAVRLEVSHDCPPDLDSFLMRQFTLNEVDFYEVSGPVNLNRLEAIYDLAQRPDLKYPIFTPGLPRRVAGSTDLLAVIRQKDVLLHHPFHSFGPVLDFLRGAASDPRVLAIKQTLYRTGNESPIVDALVAAAQSGKDVTVIVELRARFDEEANIELSTRLQEAGAHVMYGVVGFKTHAKMSMVVRRETDGLRRYCHLGTGNYHPRTARGYTDYSLFTCDPDDRPGRARAVPAAHQPHTDSAADEAAAVAFRPARTGHRENRARSRARLVRTPGPHLREDEFAGGSTRDRSAVSRVTRRRADRSDHPRVMRPAAGNSRGLGKHSRALDRRAASSNTRASSILATMATTNCSWRAPTGWSAISSGEWKSPSRCASRLIATASCATSTSTSPTTRRHGRWAVMVSTRAAHAAKMTKFATRRARCWRVTRPAVPRSPSPRRRYFALKTRRRNPTPFSSSISICRSATVSG